jgi:hypothetical protein
LELEKRISEKLTISSGYDHSTYRSDTAADYRRDDVYAGFVHRSSPKLTLNARGGVAVIDQTEDDEMTVQLLNIAANYALTEEIGFGLGYEETVDDSVDSGLVNIRTVKATLKNNRRIPTIATLALEEDEYLDSDREDLSISLIVQMNVLLRNRISIQAIPYVTWFEFKPEEDQSLRYGVGLSAQRDFKYGHLRCGYNYHASQDSEISDDYRNNVVFLEVAVRF